MLNGIERRRYSGFSSAGGLASAWIGSDCEEEWRRWRRRRRSSSKDEEGEEEKVEEEAIQLLRTDGRTQARNRSGGSSDV